MKVQLIFVAIFTVCSVLVGCASQAELDRALKEKQFITREAQNERNLKGKYKARVKVKKEEIKEMKKLWRKCVDELGQLDRTTLRICRTTLDHCEKSKKIIAENSCYKCKLDFLSEWSIKVIPGNQAWFPSIPSFLSPHDNYLTINIIFRGEVIYTSPPIKTHTRTSAVSYIIRDIIDIYSITRKICNP